MIITTNRFFRHLFAVVVLCFIVIVSFSCHNRKVNTADEKAFTSRYSLATFQTENGWGYEIKIDGKTKIKQPTIPAVSGGLAFDSEMDARRVGELVMQKLQKSKQLPTVTKKELDSLHIRY